MYVRACTCVRACTSRRACACASVSACLRLRVRVRVLCGLPYLVCARIAADVKKLGKDGLEALYVMKKPWKEEDTPALDDDHADAAAAAPVAPAGK